MHDKLILADDHPVYRTGTARILAVEDNVRIVSQCETLASLYKSITSFPNAIVLFSASLLPQPDALTESLRATNSLGIAILENADPPQNYLKQAMRGVIYRKIQTTDLVTCVRRVARGELYVQKMLTESSESLKTQVLAERVRESLTPKELLILSFVIRGYKNKQIATELKTSEQVIKNYLSSIFNKTETSDRLELALFAIHNKILSQTAADVADHEAHQSPLSTSSSPATIFERSI